MRTPAPPTPAPDSISRYSATGDALSTQSFFAADERNLRRVVIDSLGDLPVAAGDPQRLHDYMYSLMQHLNVHTLELGSQGARIL